MYMYVRAYALRAFQEFNLTNGLAVIDIFAAVQLWQWGGSAFVTDTVRYLPGILLIGKVSPGVLLVCCFCGRDAS